jgi:uncharacterized repeat protein (TIGR03806 family)
MRPRFFRSNIRQFLAAAFILAALWPSGLLAVNWVTFHYDNARDGANTNETVLTPANVNVNQFSKLFSYTVDAEMYAEPLYVANVAIPGQGTHNVIYAFTENNSIYAFDADSNQGANGGLLWQTNFGTSAISTNFGVRYHHNVLNPLIGITGTPVIDPISGTLYVDVFSATVPNTTNCLHRIHAIDITDGAERSYSPVIVAASVPGRGVDSLNGTVNFVPNQQMNRPAMTLVNGTLFAAYGSYGDTDPYHGWVIGFNAANLQPLANYAFASTPNATAAAFGVNAGEGAIWMGGDGLCADANSNLYLATANGSFSANTNGGDYGDTFVKLSTTNKLVVADYFSPSNQESMAVNDEDLGSGGPILLPDAVGSAAHPHLMAGAGKEGTIYLVDRDNMGHFSPSANNIVQTDIGVMAGIWGVPAYFNHWIYFQCNGDVMKAFGITNGVMTTSPVSKSSVSFGGTGYTTVISANGASNAIAWAVQEDAYNNGAPASSGPAILHAFNATNLSQELYNSSMNLNRDAPGGAGKYTVPVVVNGKVYVGAELTLAVYGVSVILPPPVISPNGGLYTNSVAVTLTDPTNGVAIYYTLNGAAPTTSSTLYTGPITLTNTVALNAIAAQLGAFNSAVASASFINSSSIGNGAGLLGRYWSNITSAAFTNIAFSQLPSLTRTDAIINFNFGAAGPAPSVGKTNYAVRWTGSVQPQFSEPYTFITTADDGVRLFINGKLLINDWANQSATAESNTISLRAQQLYNVELDYYYQNDNGAQVSLAWSSPSTPRAVIPQSQLYPYTNPPPTIILTNPAAGGIYMAAASVSLDALADAPNNPVSEVAFYANGALLGTIGESPDAPLYSLTATGFNVNAGGQSANSTQASATPAIPMTTTAVEAQGADWTAAIWKTNGAGMAVAPAAGQSYAAVYNGVGIGNNLNNTRIRSPAVSGTVTFPGSMLTLNTNTELRAKGVPPDTINFPAANGQPGLVLNGGFLNNGDSSANPSVATITGSIQINGLCCNSAQAANGGGGGLAANDRAIDLAGSLSGSGSMVIMNCFTNIPQIVSGAGNTFSGQWIVQCGWLQGAAAGALGTNSSVIVDPNYTGYLAAMPGASSPIGPALFEVNYDFATAGTLTLVNGGLMNLHQNCVFSAVTIEGAPLGSGAHSCAELSGNFPRNFLPGGSGRITVGPASAPGPVFAPPSLSAFPGNGQVSLSWSASPGATNYILQRAMMNGGPYTPVTNQPGTSYTDTGLANGTAYYYVVSALSAPGYTLTAVATDGSGLCATSAPVQITITPGSGLPYGLTTNGITPGFLNMPSVIPAVLPGTIPPLLSQTGAFSDTAGRAPAGGLIPYAPNTPLWSDGAQKSRYMALPNPGGLITPDQQIGFARTNSWTFPAGTVFVKHFDLAVNTTNPAVPLRRLETRLLVRDINGGVYGVTYKWRPDNSDADLLMSSLAENILVTNATGVTNQTWYYPSPADCLTCHTPAAGFVLGINARQLNGNLTYPSTGVTDNQIRTLNRLGLFNPAINEGTIGNMDQLAALTNLNASLQQRCRSYLDANCAQCHQPGGTGITFDARYDTPLPLQNITNYPAQLTLGIDGACIVKDQDVWRSTLLVRMSSLNGTVQMPPLARNLVDTNAVQVFTDWINSLPGTPALPPPAITPGGGAFLPSVTVALRPPFAGAAVYYTLDGTLPATNSFLYSAPLLLTNSLTLTASAWEAGFNNSAAASAQFTVLPGLALGAPGFSGNGVFQFAFSGLPGSNYVVQVTSNLVDWIPFSTNTASNGAVNLFDTNAFGFPSRFYRVVGQ